MSDVLDTERLRTSGPLPKRRRREETSSLDGPSSKKQRKDRELTDSDETSEDLLKVRTTVNQEAKEIHADCHGNSTDGIHEKDDEVSTFNQSGGAEKLPSNGSKDLSTPVEGTFVQDSEAQEEGISISVDDPKGIPTLVDGKFPMDFLEKEQGLCTSREKRRKKDKYKDKVDLSSADGLWARSLKGPNLDLMVSLKQLAVERLKNTGDPSLSCSLKPAALRTIGIILEELVRDRMEMEIPSLNIDYMDATQALNNRQQEKGPRKLVQKDRLTR